MRALLSTLLLLFTLTAQAQFPGTNQSGLGTAAPEFLPVEEAYRMDGEFTPEGLRLFWQIADGYYLYRHRLGFELSLDGESIAVEAAIPAGLQRHDEFFGDVEVFYQSLDIPISSALTTGTALLEVRSQGCADAGLCYPPQNNFYQVDFSNQTLTPVERPKSGARNAPVTGSDSGSSLSLGVALVFAFFGGMILNLMPCVFPVLSLKVLSFAQSQDHERHQQGWAYAAGVVLSFLLIAGLLIALQQAGSAVGWGFQLQSPHFVTALAFLFVAMGLMLSGVVEIGGSWMGAGQRLTEGGGLRGSFFSGVLATVVASPCTAPFMGTALGFAIAQPAAIALLVFGALGAGMAAPLVLLSYSRGLRRIMPRPGPWMDTFKQVMAFPLYATAIWLLWVVGRQTSVDTLALLLLGLLLLTLGLWLWRYSRIGKALAAACMVLAVGTATLAPGPREVSERSLEAHQQAWSKETMAQALAAGQPVFVDFTADWCITCIANERAVLHRDDVQQAFIDAGITYMIADWTNYDEDIARFLEDHGRNGIPFYILYSGNNAEAPVVLPQLLTRGAVLDAIEQVSAKNGKLAASSQ